MTRFSLKVCLACCTLLALRDPKRRSFLPVPWLKASLGQTMKTVKMGTVRLQSGLSLNVLEYFHSIYSMSIVNALDSLLSTALHSAEVLKWQRMARNLEDSCDHHETQGMASENEKLGPESIRRSPISDAQTSNIHCMPYTSSRNFLFVGSAA